MDLNKELVILLVRHQKLTLNKIGTFSIVDEAAQIHPINHTFLPPQKNIAFEYNTDASDNIFRDHLITSFSLAEVDAENAIDEFVKNLISNLDDSGKHFFDKMGSLIKNTDNTFVFEKDHDFVPDNSYFGLDSFVAPAIQRSKEGIKVVSERKPRKKLKPVFIILLLLLLFVTAGGITYYFLPEVVNKSFLIAESKIDDLTSKIK
ncbi:MAG: hypothetical protein PHT69_14025, partial [Bacteroidales bacterium]|nr:hypothetical protein [Bacteroidales bacterium]